MFSAPVFADFWACNPSRPPKMQCHCILAYKDGALQGKSVLPGTARPFCAPRGISHIMPPAYIHIQNK
jgi:hypothetical protein